MHTNEYKLKSIGHSEIASIVKRLKALVALHGGHSQKISRAKFLYGWLESSKDRATFNLLEAEVTRLEQEDEARSTCKVFTKQEHGLD